MILDHGDATSGTNINIIQRLSRRLTWALATLNPDPKLTQSRQLTMFRANTCTTSDGREAWNTMLWCLVEEDRKTESSSYIVVTFKFSRLKEDKDTSLVLENEVVGKN